MAFLRIFVDDALIEQRELLADRTTIGRAPDNDIVFNSRGISKHHAVIEKDGDAFVLVDCDSANGVFVGGKRVRRHTLHYWDEIQVFNFVLKFMAVPRLKGEEVRSDNWEELPAAQEATMEVDISTRSDLARLRRRIKIPVISMLRDAGVVQSYTLDKVNFKIGRSADCDLKTSGWLAPRLAACIQRRQDGCYLLPSRRGRVLLNGRRVSAPTMLRDHDDLSVRGLALRFCHRPIAEA